MHKETGEDAFNDAENDSENEVNEGEEEKKAHQGSNEIKIKQLPNPNIRKKLPKQLRIHNKTLFKYQINKPNRIVENENSLQRINGILKI